MGNYFISVCKKSRMFGDKKRCEVWRCIFGKGKGNFVLQQNDLLFQNEKEENTGHTKWIQKVEEREREIYFVWSSWLKLNEFIIKV